MIRYRWEPVGAGIETQPKPCSNTRVTQTSDQTPPDQAIADLCDGCVRFVEHAVGLKLDYSPETLPFLDHFLRLRLQSESEEESAPTIELIAATLGAYFGEVVRRKLGHARWTGDSTDPRSLRRELEPFFLAISPGVIAAEVIAPGDETRELPAAFEVVVEARPAVQAALERQGEVELDDYYSFSLRYEALELIANVLAGLEEARGEARSFGPEVYRAALDEHAPEDPKDAS
jgi:hypothetical protein